MYLEHINLVVRDIPETLKFYRAAFPHWHIRAQGDAEWFGVMRRWVHFGDDRNYLTFNDDGVGANRDLRGHQTGLAHFAFVTNDIKAVIKRLNDAGYPIEKPGAENKYRDNVYFIDPNGFEVEFVQYFSDIPEEKNSDE